MAAVPVNRRYEIEPRGASIACLNAVDPLHRPEQMIVIAHRFAAIDESLDRKVLIVSREAFLDCSAEQCLIFGGCDLNIIRQAGGIHIRRTRHPKTPSL